MKNVNIIYSESKTLLPIVKQLFTSEKTIYETNGYGGDILRINYKNNVTFSVNEDYEVAQRDAESLSIPFRNQNLIHLVNEAFAAYREDDRVQSTFNAATKQVFFDHIKRPFDHTYYQTQMLASSRLIFKSVTRRV